MFGLKMILNYVLPVAALVLISFHVDAAPVESLTIDEKIALANSIAGNGSVEISPDGKSVRVEYDMVKKTPIKRKGHQRPQHSGKSRNSRAAVLDTNFYWPNGVIPYVITSVFDNTERQKIKNAMEEFEKHTCVRFVPRTNQASFVNIIKDGGCWSYVGTISGKQDLSLGSGCVYKDIIVHELMHAAGIEHEHQRKDRDTKIEVLSQNVDKSNLAQFRIEENTNDYKIPYDYRSVMHYGKMAFSSNGQTTIRTKQPEYQNIIGGSPTMDFFDIMLISTMYKCNEKCAAGIQCPSNGFVAHDCSCYCSVDGNDRDPPVLKCGGGTSPCQALDSPCSCNQDPNTMCSELSNSVCNVDTGVCECSSDFAAYHGACVNPSTITCATLGAAECQCGLNEEFACQNLLNSKCNTTTGQCLCKDGYVAVEGKCVAPNALDCSDVGVVCLCSSKVGPACDSLNNTVCDTVTEACVCMDGYYNTGGGCSLPPACSTVNEDCRCHLQGDDACSSLENADCNVRTGACECQSGYRLQSEDNSCAVDTAAVLVNDGSAISPLFNAGADDGDWVVANGLDYAGNGALPNDKFLSASSEDPDAIIILETPELPAGTYCVMIAVDLVGSSLFITAEFGPEARGTTFMPGDTEGIFIPEETRVRLTEPDKILFEAESFGSDTWQVRLDAIRIKLCGEPGGYESTTESYYYY